MRQFLTIQPTRGTLFTRVQSALEREYRSNSMYPTVLRTDSKSLLDARNWLAQEAVKSEAEIVLFLDDDVVLPEGAFKALEKALEKCDIAVIDYPHHWHPLLSQTEPTGVTVYTQWMPGEDVSTKEIAWSGLGCTAVTRKTLEKMAKEMSPLFVNTAHPVATDVLGRMGLTPTGDRGLGGQKREYSGGEDTNFFLKARGMGLKIALVPNMVASHLRLDHAVSWVAEEKYTTLHTVEESKEIKVPGNALHMDMAQFKKKEDK